MFDFIATRDRLAEFPTAEMLIGLCLLVLVAFIADFVVRRILTRLILRIVGRAVHLQVLQGERQRLGPVTGQQRGAPGALHRALAGADRHRRHFTGRRRRQTCPSSLKSDQHMAVMWVGSSYRQCPLFRD